MSTLTLPEIPLETNAPAQRLRRIAAAVRVHFTWWGVHKTLTAHLYRQEQERVARRFDEAVQLAEEAFTAEFAGWWPTWPSGWRRGRTGSARCFATAQLPTWWSS